MYSCYGRHRVNVLFGNRNEFLTFVSCSRRLGYKSKILNAISNFFEVPQHESQQTSLIERYTDVVVTDGPADVISFKVDNSGAVHDVESVATPSLAPGDIVDTIGAGDAFVAGYMEALMMARGRRECMRRGVRRSGTHQRPLSQGTLTADLRQPSNHRPGGHQLAHGTSQGSRFLVASHGLISRL